MEVFKASVLENNVVFCGVSAFRPNLSYSANPYRKNQTCIKRNRLSFLRNTPIWSSSSPSNVSKLRISAHFGRSTKRRNSLRKKLVEEEQVRTNPDVSNSEFILNNPNYISEQNNNFELNSNYENPIETSFRASGSDIVEGDSVEKSKVLGESVLWSKLENWVDQYKNDSAYWGVGSSPIFTVYQDLGGNVDKVLVNEDEIIRRSHVDPWAFKRQELREEFDDVYSKISRAKLIAREIETKEYKFPRNSTIAKFVAKGKQSFSLEGLRSGVLRGRSFSKLPQVGFVMLCACFVFLAIKKIFVIGNDEVELTRVEKEMLRRKIRSRMEREKMESGNVEVIPNNLEISMESNGRPQLDKSELIKNISKSETFEENVKISDSSSDVSACVTDFDVKIREIREMARRARELERQDTSQVEKDGEENDLSSMLQDIKDDSGYLDSNFDTKSDVVRRSDFDTISEIKSQFDDKTNGELSVEMMDDKMHKDKTVEVLKDLSDGELEKSLGTNGTIKHVSAGNPKTDGVRCLSEVSGNSDSQSDTRTESMKGLEDKENLVQYSNERESSTLSTLDTREEVKLRNSSSSSSEISVKMKPKIIRSVKEAREYLSQRQGIPTDKGMHEQEVQDKSPLLEPDVQAMGNAVEPNGKANQSFNERSKILEFPKLEKTDPSFFTSASENFHSNIERSDDDALSSQVSADADSVLDAERLKTRQSWMEKNFHEFEPIVKKIGVGFQDNYLMAKEKVQEQSSLNAGISQLGLKEDDEGLGWMKDDGLREIVFKVRENELAGRDPFHLMADEDKQAFFKGLEKKVDKVNAKMSDLHELIHSRVENLDYGADGISLDDPLEKIVPRWKGPPLDEDPEFLNNFVEHRKKFVSENLGKSQPVNGNAQNILKKSGELPSSDAITPSSAVDKVRQVSQNGVSTNPKTVIESSDGSIRAGKKSGKEHWEHTKKWSREFLEMYNAETDPEVKSIMKDMGKDLDKWITDKEIQDAADLMTRIPKRKRRYLKKRLEKLKREMEMFGPQAVVSKYREYSEEKEEDYLWWLDLQYVLCIELYRIEDGVQKVGFYSLEMATDLELDPKQYHVISFEDPGDSKNFCYIIQAHLEMLGNGHAFVVSRPPKDAFREAKANGFNVTVIRKGELQLNVDQTLEEVEDEITEIGSKMYHDKIMRERSVDMGAIVKGVFGAGKSTKRRRSKLMLSKRTDN
ncbi:embryo defective 1703 [Tasmannia lanceolata]|uniref:embryo defective 1703 n=1 Tax=Tasmannia lanceolata TaxID=3420 RepID=UPI0040641FE6